MTSSHFASIFRPGLFDGSVILVTGGGTGIGRCMAHELASLGAQVVISGRRMEPLESTVKEIEDAGGVATAHSIDIRDEEAVEAGVAAVIAEHGKLDGLINNAGGQFPSPAEEIKPKGWRAVIDTNLNGTWWMSRAVFDQWMGEHGGAIVNIVADVWSGYPGMAHTGAARAGVINITKTLGFEWIRHGVRVNAVAPGPILSSGMTNYPEPILQRILNESRDLPSARFGTESEVSAAAVFLLTPAAAFITAETIKVDGATSIHKGHFTPIGHHDKLTRFDGFHLRAKLPDSLAVLDEKAAGEADDEASA